MELELSKYWFCVERKTGEPREKLLEAGTSTNIKLTPLQDSSPGHQGGVARSPSCTISDPLKPSCPFLVSS